MNTYGRVEDLTVSRGLRVLALVVGAVVAVYMVACTASELPASPVQVRAAKYSNKLINPYFEQDWQLFAPNPPTTNNGMLVTVVTRNADGSATKHKPFDMEAAIERMPRFNHWTPTKMPGLTLGANERFNGYRTQLAYAEQLKGREKSETIKTLNHKFSTAFDELSRAGSYFAKRHFPDQSILKLRITFTQTNIVPFSERNTARAEKPKTLLVTSWLPYHDVATG